MSVQLELGQYKLDRIELVKAKALEATQLEEELLVGEDIGEAAYVKGNGQSNHGCSKHDGERMKTGSKNKNKLAVQSVRDDVQRAQTGGDCVQPPDVHRAQTGGDCVQPLFLLKLRHVGTVYNPLICYLNRGAPGTTTKLPAVTMAPGTAAMAACSTGGNQECEEGLGRDECADKAKFTDFEEGLIDDFKALDRDGNGFITAGELRCVMMDRGEKLTY